MFIAFFVRSAKRKRFGTAVVGIATVRVFSELVTQKCNRRMKFIKRKNPANAKFHLRPELPWPECRLDVGVPLFGLTFNKPHRSGLLPGVTKMPRTVTKIPDQILIIVCRMLDFISRCWVRLDDILYKTTKIDEWSSYCILKRYKNITYANTLYITVVFNYPLNLKKAMLINLNLIMQIYDLFESFEMRQNQETRNFEIYLCVEKLDIITVKCFSTIIHHTYLLEIIYYLQ